ncbi:ATP-dependent Clp protease proteolytic subunit 4 [Orobanche gracilis]
MISLTLPTPLTNHSISYVRRPSLLRNLPPTGGFIHTPKHLTQTPKCSSPTSFHHQTLTSPASPESLLIDLSDSSSQTLATALPGTEADAFSLLLKERILFLGNEIDDFFADSIISQMILLDAQEPTKDIRLFINSPGGSPSAAMAIFDMMHLVQADVSTVALGISASTASIILGGGTKGKRFAMPNARIVINQPFGGIGGHPLDVAIHARELMQNKENITRIISDFTGRPFEQVEKDIRYDRYMSPVEAVEYGIIDGVIDEDSIIPLMTVSERVEASTLTDEEISTDPNKFLTLEILDDELF